MRLRVLLGAAVAAVLSLAVLPSAAEPHRPQIVRTDGSSFGAESSAACAGASFPDSIDGHFYKYCGQHWPLNKLPVRIHINSFGAKPNAGAFREAVNLAVQSWDAVAPISGTGPRTGCSGAARIICVASSSNGPGAAGEVDVRWGKTGVLGLPAVADVSPSAGPISDVEITLNWDLTWFGTSDATSVAVGAPVGLAAGIGCLPVPALCPPRFDLVGILMHELGHALGLEDLNPNPSCEEPDNPFKCGYPADLEDAPDYTHVMYAFYYSGSSTKRLLQEGDILGLQRVLLDSAAG